MTGANITLINITSDLDLTLTKWDRAYGKPAGCVSGTADYRCRQGYLLAPGMNISGLTQEIVEGLPLDDFVGTDAYADLNINCSTHNPHAIDTCTVPENAIVCRTT